MWSPNPFVIAQLLLPSGRGRDYSTWVDAKALLEQAFQTKLEMVFDPDGSSAPAWQPFRDFIEQFRSPHTLDAIMAAIKQQPLGKAAIKKYGEHAIQQVLPFLVPVSDATFTRPGTYAAQPRDIAIYKSIGAFVNSGASYLDPRQGMVADCYLISSMISLAWAQPKRWQKYLDNACSHDATDERYRFKFTLEDNEEPCPAFDVQPWVPVDESNQPYFAGSSDAGEAWPALVEKAFVMQRRNRASEDPVPADYQFVGDDLHRLYPKHACRMLIGGSGDFETNDHCPLLTPFVKCDERGVTLPPTMATSHDVAVTAMTDKGLSWGNTGLVSGHAYAVLGMMKQRNVEYVVLRNPHGVSNNTITKYAHEAWEPGPGENGVATVVLNEGGVFAIPVDWFEACFFRVDWVDVAPAHP